MGIDRFCLFITFVILLVASVNDLFYRKIPNWLTFSSLLIGIILQSIFRGFEGFGYSLQGVGVGFALTFFLYLAGGLGAGDVKLMAAIGGFLGPKEIFLVFILSSMLSGIYALILLSIHGFIFQTTKRFYKIIKALIFTRQLLYIPPLSGEKKLRIRFGIMIALGTLITELYRNILPTNSIFIRF